MGVKRVWDVEGVGRGGITHNTSKGCGRHGWVGVRRVWDVVGVGGGVRQAWDVIGVGGGGGGVTRLWDVVGVSGGGRGRKTSMGFDRSGRLEASHEYGMW